MNKIIITIAGVEYTIKQSFRALMLFEELTGKSVSLMNETMADITKLFYCIVKGNNREKFNYTFDEFIDLLDAETEVFTVFTDFLQEQAKGLVQEEKKN